MQGDLEMKTVLEVVAGRLKICVPNSYLGSAVGSIVCSFPRKAQRL
jgi:hypothetical protein